ncbi:NRDE family protein [Insolitispirillum peregrinum]|uniref:Uncharacterized conserved protein, contains NRDE domain n=1 Tax=Insolitispirillum peregrinum TaxID=80876 RepID=A0A1N7LLF5_9PROT|nr:NRDE family protein [Insolitispirillum peregrinum]SIS74637.1 Uncharacterized conserved protein, contains NRDE domain [Insolitispirillum peregrinum]
MCSIILLRRPTHPWPLLVAANRDEMRDRPWRPPARHWPDRPEVMAGQDTLAEGSWLGVNDHGVMAAILNRHGTLGPAPGKRSRGELVLEALDHADAVEAADALRHLDGRAYRPFNMVIADNRDAWWLKHSGRPDGRIEAFPLPEGLSMLTAFDVNDSTHDPRIAAALPRFASAPVPDPDNGDWRSWQMLLADRTSPTDDDPRHALCFMTEKGFGTSSSSLIALPAIGTPAEVKPKWLFAAGAPDQVDYQPLSWR